MTTLMESVAFFDWCLLLMASSFFLVVYRAILDWPSQTPFHWIALLMWFTFGAAYNVLIYVRLGEAEAGKWLIGYLLELIFSVENVFVFHVIVKAFKMSRRTTQRILFVVVLVQAVSQLVFYMGLADWLRSLQVLPYALGFWLVCVGFQAAMESEADHKDLDIMNTSVVQGFRSILGDRMLTTDGCDGEMMITKKGKLCLSPAGLLCICVVLADIVLEMDVTVTKIESMLNPYICFSSSLVASFAMPELFFISRDLFRRFFGLKYGIAFILCFTGVQAFLHKVFTLSEVANLGIIVAAMSFSIVVSIARDWGRGYVDSEPLP